METEEGTDIRNHLGMILKASQRAKELVHQILAFSRQRPLDVQIVSLESIVQEVMSLLRASLPRTIDIREQIATDLYSIEADPSQIHQVLMNLCTNAAHAMEEKGGQLAVNLENVFIEKERSPKLWDLSPGKFVRLSVQDTGHGITPETLDRIFDPYFTTKKLGKGTGMGLAVTHGIVKNLDGAITVESQPEKGTRFDIYLPGYLREENEKRETDQVLPRGSENILFVDDEENLVDITTDLLQRLGYRVTSTNQPRVALEWFRADPSSFDLVITDAAMPLLTGDRLAGELLSIRKDVPIIMCTGYSEKVGKNDIKTLNIRRLMLKPVALSNLSRVIREVLDESSESKARGPMKTQGKA